MEKYAQHMFFSRGNFMMESFFVDIVHLSCIRSNFIFRDSTVSDAITNI